MLDIEVQGARKLKETEGFKANFLFIQPPSFEELAARIKTRGSIDEESIKQRIEVAKKEIELVETDPNFSFFKHRVVNLEKEAFLKEAREIIYSFYPTLTKNL